MRWCSSIYAISLFGIISVIYVTLDSVDSTHQRWWLLGCACTNWQSRRTLEDIVVNMYRGLFVRQKQELHRLPIVKLHRRTEGNLDSYIGNNILSLVNRTHKSRGDCCATDYQYEVFNTTFANKKKIKVVHFDNAFQFVPTGRCVDNRTCFDGRCIQRFRHHWLLVWDDKLTHYPPVTFLPVEVPSHCECANVGTG